MELTEKLAQLDGLQKKLYAFTCAESSLYLDSVTVAPKNTAEGRGVALSILAGERQKLLTARRPRHCWMSWPPNRTSLTLSTSGRWSCCAASAKR